VEFLLGGYKFDGRRLSERISILAIIIISLVTFFRFDIGFDYASYFKYVSDDKIPSMELLFLEPSARIFIEFSRIIDFPPALIMIYGAISIVFTSSAIIKNSENIPLSVIVFLGLFYLSTICFIRQGAALGIILFSYPYLKNNQFWKFFICCAFAVLLHYSAILVLIVYPLYTCFSYRKLGLILLISLPTILIALKSLPILFPWLPYVSYFTTSENLTGGNMAKYVFLLLNLTGLLLSWKTKDSEIIKFFEIAMIGSFFPFSLGGHIGGRIGWYFMIFICIALPNLLKRYPLWYSRLCNAAMVACFLGTIYVSSLSPGKKQYTPFQTIFEVDLKHPVFKE